MQESTAFILYIFHWFFSPLSPFWSFSEPRIYMQHPTMLLLKNVLLFSMLSYLFAGTILILLPLKPFSYIPTLPAICDNTNIAVFKKNDDCETSKLKMAVLFLIWKLSISLVWSWSFIIFMQACGWKILCVFFHHLFSWFVQCSHSSTSGSISRKTHSS